MEKKKNILFRKINFISKPLEEDKGAADDVSVSSSLPWYIFIFESLAGALFWIIGERQRKKEYRKI